MSYNKRLDAEQGRHRLREALNTERPLGMLHWPEVSVAASVAAAAPGNDGAVALQGQAVCVAGGDRGHAGEAARHAALPEVIIVAAAAPGDHCASRRSLRAGARSSAKLSTASIKETEGQTLTSL
jgi:hypothetical protein